MAPPSAGEPRSGPASEGPELPVPGGIGSDQRLVLEIAGELLELVLRDRVGVLLLVREGAGADLIRVRAHALQGLSADVGEALDELRGAYVVDTEQVVQHEHLAIRCRAGADPDHG